MSIMDSSEFLKMAYERIENLDVSSAIQDCVNFVRDQESIKRTWSKDFFSLLD